MRRGVLLVIVLAGLTASPIPAEEQARASIQACYQKAARAATLHYVAGMLSVRSPDYEVFGPDGKKMDLSLERTRFQSLFDSSLTASLKTEIVSFQELGPSKATCVVHQVLEVQKVDPRTLKVVSVVLDERSLDEWVKTGKGWRLLSSHVKQQGFRRGNP